MTVKMKFFESRICECGKVEEIDFCLWNDGTVVFNVPDHAGNEIDFELSIDDMKVIVSEIEELQRRAPKPE